MVRLKLKDGKKLEEKNIEEDRLQEIVEKHCEDLLNCFMIKHKFSFLGRHGTIGGELDSLMLDKDNYCPVIVEYKKAELKRNYTAINQIVYYYDWMKDHQDEISNLMMKHLKSPDLESEIMEDFDSEFQINWDDDVKCIIIAKEFSDWDKVLLGYLSIDIELYTYRYYEDDVFDLNREKELQNAIKSKKKKQLNFLYEENFHLENRPSFITGIYKELKTEILNIDENIELATKQQYIGFKINNKRVVYMKLTNDHIKIVLSKRKSDFKDPNEILENIPESHGWGKKSHLTVRRSDEIEYAINLIKQSYDKLKSKE